MESRGRCGHPRERGGGLVYLCLMLTGYGMYCYLVTYRFACLGSCEKKKNCRREKDVEDGTDVEIYVFIPTYKSMDLLPASRGWQLKTEPFSSSHTQYCSFNSLTRATTPTTVTRATTSYCLDTSFTDSLCAQPNIVSFRRVKNG